MSDQVVSQNIMQLLHDNIDVNWSSNQQKQPVQTHLLALCAGCAQMSMPCWEVRRRTGSCCKRSILEPHQDSAQVFVLQAPGRPAHAARCFVGASGGDDMLAADVLS